MEAATRQASLVMLGDPLSVPYTMSLWVIPGQARHFDETFEIEVFPDAIRVFGPAEQVAVAAVADQLEKALVRTGVQVERSYVIGD